jgi:hypothetical protein
MQPACLLFGLEEQAGFQYIINMKYQKKREAGRSVCCQQLVFFSILAVVFLAGVAHGQSTATMSIRRLAASDRVGRADYWKQLAARRIFVSRTPVVPFAEMTCQPAMPRQLFVKKQ